MIRVYRSDDASAPSLTGVGGSLITLLDACLVNGYGAKAAAGWAKSFSGANLAVYRPPQGNRFYLRLDDSHAQYPALRGYRTMSDGNTGTGLFPSTVQLSGGIRSVKSYTTGSTVRPWIVIASPRSLYLWLAFNATEMGVLSTYTDMVFFGDVVSYLAGDAYGTAIIGKIVADTTASSTRFASTLTTGTQAEGHYLASDFAQSGNPVQVACLQALLAGSSHAGSAGSFYPDPITGGMLLERLRIVEGGTAQKLVRGHLPGCYNPIHALPANHLDVLQGRGAMQGTDMLVLYKGGTEGRVVISLTESDWYPAS